MRIASRAYLDPEPGDGPHVSLDRLADGAGGLIALSGGPSGPLDRALLGGAPEQAAARLERLARLFPGRLYIELQRHGLAEERRTEASLARPRFRARTAARRHQRAVFRDGRRLRSP